MQNDTITSFTQASVITSVRWYGYFTLKNLDRRWIATEWILSVCSVATGKFALVHQTTRWIWGSALISFLHAFLASSQEFDGKMHDSLCFPLCFSLMGSCKDTVLIRLPLVNRPVVKRPANHWHWVSLHDAWQQHALPDNLRHSSWALESLQFFFNTRICKNTQK